jgi:hypothetical protein
MKVGARTLFARFSVRPTDKHLTILRQRRASQQATATSNITEDRKLSRVWFALVVRSGDNDRRRAHGSEPSPVQCGSPVASPGARTVRNVSTRRIRPKIGTDDPGLCAAHLSPALDRVRRRLGDRQQDLRPLRAWKCRPDSPVNKFAKARTTPALCAGTYRFFAGIFLN